MISDDELRAAQTPLLDLLLGVPKDGVHSYQHSQTHGQNVPYGRLCHEAAAEILAARERIRAMGSALLTCATTFRDYERIHVEKGAYVKAGRNATLALQCECVLAALPAGPKGPKGPKGPG